MRKTYIDNTRWITVVLVVIYHVIYIFNGVTTYGIIGPFSKSQPQDVYQYIVYPWFMLLLFVISGMCARFELDKNGEKGFIKKRTVRYLVPSTIALFVFWWTLGYYNMLMSGAFDSMGSLPKPALFAIMSISGSGPLWYIQVLWLFSVLLILVRRIEKDRLYDKCSKVNVPMILSFTVLIYLSAQVLNTPVVVVYRFGIYGMGFFIGYFVLSHEEVMERVGKSWIPLTVLALIFSIVFPVMYWGRSYAEHDVLDTIVCNIYAWTGTVGILAFMWKWGNFDNAFSRWMSRKSWGLYVFHYLMIAISGWYLHKLVPPLSPFAVYILVAICAFAGAFLLYEMISRIPVLRWCVLGIGKEKKA